MQSSTPFGLAYVDAFRAVSCVSAAVVGAEHVAGRRDVGASNCQAITCECSTTNLQVVQISSADQYRGLERHASLPEFDMHLLASHRPDAHWVVVNEDRADSTLFVVVAKHADDSKRQGGFDRTLRSGRR